MSWNTESFEQRERVLNSHRIDCKCFRCNPETAKTFWIGRKRSPLSEERKKHLSKLMKINNPMFKPESKAKLSELMKKSNPAWRQDVRKKQHDLRFKDGHIHKSGYVIMTLYGKKIKKHRLIWEQHYGSIPKGYIIHHKNGNKLDNKIENLELMTQSEHTKLHNAKQKK